jgi:phospholipid-binding lipoprotein MlaA
MSLSGMTSAMLLVGAPVNIGGVSLSLPAELVAQTKRDQAQSNAAAGPSLAPTTAAPPVAATATSMPNDPSSSPPVQAAPQSPPLGAEEQPEEVIVSSSNKTPGDPLESINLVSFEIAQAVDNAVVGPVALTFAKVVPTPVRDGLGNFLFNLKEPTAFVNYVLQHKVGKAAETVARFVINTTIGIGGLFDVAKKKPFRLPRRANGFGNTFAFYGVKSGAYLFVPIVGPTTVRDFIGYTMDQLLLPVTFGPPFNRIEFSLPATTARTLDHRAYFDEELRRLKAGPKDLYSARRDLYLQMRQDELDDLHHRPRTPYRRPVAPGAAKPAPQPGTTPPLIPTPAPAMPTP